AGRGAPATGSGRRHRCRPEPRSRRTKRPESPPSDAGRGEERRPGDPRARRDRRAPPAMNPDLRPGTSFGQARAVLCDLDGTLYRPGPMKLLMAAELLLLGAHRLALLRAFRHEHERLREELAKNEQLRFEPTPFDEQIMRTAQLRALEPALLRGVVLEW